MAKRRPDKPGWPKTILDSYTRILELWDALEAVRAERDRLKQESEALYQQLAAHGIRPTYPTQ